MVASLKSYYSELPQRWIFVIMGFLAFFNAYAMRVCLSMTITKMTVPLNVSENFADQTCTMVIEPEFEHIENVTIIEGDGVYHWSEYTQGIVLSSFYWGCVATHLPGGWIAENFGGKFTLGFSIFISAVTSFLTPMAVWWGDSDALIILRVIMGLACGTLYPAANVMLSNWVPLEERSKAGAFVFAGASVGTAFANSISGVILEYYSWSKVFYFFGIIGIFWYLLFSIICYNNPTVHPFISEAEVKYLEERLNKNKDKKLPPVPWKQIITSLPVWAATAANVGHAWGFLTLISDLPKYMNSVLKFPIQHNGYLSALPLLSMWIGGMACSVIFDWLISSKRLSSTTVRKIGVTISSIGPAIFLIAASYAGCNRTLVVVFLTTGMTLMGISLPSARVNILDLSQNYSGSLMAFINQFVASMGILGPYVVGLLTPNQTLEEWRIVFWIMFSVLISTNVVFLLFGSGKVQKWNNPEL